MAKKIGNLIGKWAFLIGVVLAIVLGVAGQVTEEMVVAFVVVGVVVGLLNVAAAESMPFLMSGAVLVIVSSLGQMVTASVPLLDDVLKALLLIFVPSTIIVAIRNVFNIARR